jgi:hypothetical protein
MLCLRWFTWHWRTELIQLQFNALPGYWNLIFNLLRPMAMCLTWTVVTCKHEHTPIQVNFSIFIVYHVVGISLWSLNPILMRLEWRGKKLAGPSGVNLLWVDGKSLLLNIFKMDQGRLVLFWPCIYMGAKNSWGVLRWSIDWQKEELLRYFGVALVLK